MAHPDSDRTGPRGSERGTGPDRLASASRRAGVALLASAVPLAAGTVALAAFRGGLSRGPVAWATGAMDTPLLGGDGLAWAFHAAVIAGLTGVWFVGLALVVEGYFGVG
ncbi:MAG: hypothetical protein ABEJ40_04820 [Haloarculaceae archaeon]